MAFQPGFDVTEATATLALSQAIYGVPAIPVPTPDPHSLGWSKVDALSPSGPTLLDNLWQVWRDDTRPNRYAIVVRGTVDSDASILADLLFPLVDARLDLAIETGGFRLEFPFHLARDEAGSAVVAGTHLGFSLSLFLMLLTTDRPLLTTLAALSLDPEAEILITGHSQGASIATLLTSFVRHASGSSRISRSPPTRPMSSRPPSPATITTAMTMPASPVLRAGAGALSARKAGCRRCPLPCSFRATSTRPTPCATIAAPATSISTRASPRFARPWSLRSRMRSGRSSPMPIGSPEPQGPARGGKAHARHKAAGRAGDCRARRHIPRRRDRQHTVAHPDIAELRNRRQSGAALRRSRREPGRSDRLLLATSPRQLLEIPAGPIRRHLTRTSSRRAGADGTQPACHCTFRTALSGKRGFSCLTGDMRMRLIGLALALGATLLHTPLAQAACRMRQRSTPSSPIVPPRDWPCRRSPPAPRWTTGSAHRRWSSSTCRKTSVRWSATRRA
ncbi:MAG: hypothetical protein HPM95_05370 [Alphaproteobacteria bacterium]|nr:hypothetical protein [Alphaproteobacteria bacterium]